MWGGIHHLRIHDKLAYCGERILAQHTHFEFCTFEMRFRFARDPTSLLTPPFLKPDIWRIRDNGTTSWFFEPISVYDFHLWDSARQREARAAQPLAHEIHRMWHSAGLWHPTSWLRRIWMIVVVEKAIISLAPAQTKLWSALNVLITRFSLQVLTLKT